MDCDAVAAPGQSLNENMPDPYDVPPSWVDMYTMCRPLKTTFVKSFKATQVLPVGAFGEAIGADEVHLNFVGRGQVTPAPPTPPLPGAPAVPVAPPAVPPLAAPP